MEDGGTSIPKWFGRTERMCELKFLKGYNAGPRWMESQGEVARAKGSKISEVEGEVDIRLTVRRRHFK